MIKTRILAAISLVIINLIFFTSCRKPKEEVKLLLGQYEVVTSHEGGSFSVVYRVENALEEICVNASADADWITGIDVSEYGNIRFMVEANPEEELRTATLTVTHPAVEKTAIISIVQSEAIVSDPYFVISVKDITPISAIMDIVPKEDEMLYISMVVDQQYIDERNLGDDEAMFQDDLAFFNKYIEEGYSMEQILEAYARKGPQDDVAINDLEQATEYQIYAYGVSYDGAELSRVTDISRCNFTTGEVTITDARWDLKVEIEESDAFVTVLTDYKGPWYFDAASKADLEEFYPDMSIENAVSAYWDELVAVYKMNGFTIPDIINTIAETAPEESYLFELMAETAYYVYAFGLDESTALIGSNVAVKEFRTSAVSRSDNQISVNVSDITTTSAKVTVYTSNKDPYVMVTGKASEIEGMTDDELYGYIVENYPMDVIKGKFEETLTGLPIQTEMFVVAFGYKGGVMTTDLKKKLFTTADFKECDDKIVFDYGSYYSTEEVYNADNYWDYRDFDVLIPVKVSSDPENNGGKFYYGLYTEATHGSLTDDQLRVEIVGRGEGKYANVWILWYSANGVPTEYFIAGFVTDAEGAWGPIVRTEPFTVSPEGVDHDVQECIEILNDLYHKEEWSASSTFSMTVPDALIGGVGCRIKRNNTIDTETDDVPVGYISAKFPEILPGMHSPFVADRKAETPLR